MSDNRIEQTTPARRRVERRRNGEPIIPTAWNKYIVMLLSALGGVASLPLIPGAADVLPHSYTNAALAIVLVLGPVFGVTSAGIRKRQDSPADQQSDDQRE